MSRARRLWQGVSAAVSGVVFGVGLAAAQMTDPNKVLNFLDLGGTWDASLLLVLGAATGLFALAYQVIRRRPAPLLDDHFHLPAPQSVDASLVAGSVLFGIGWGLAGYCPAPVIASLGFGNPESAWFIAALVVGIALQRGLARHARLREPVNA